MLSKRRETPMNTNIVKTCKIHGELTETQVIKVNMRRKNMFLRCKKCNLLSVRKYQKNNPDKTKFWDKKRSNNPKRKLYNKIRNFKKYGLTIEKYNSLLIKQNNKCAICSSEEKSKQNNGIHTRQLAIDHCHKTGKIRSLLCSQCNKGIGHFNDSIELLNRVIEYLSKHNS